MPNVMSPEAILANQQNAQKSTGPRTLAGKARASRNALKYGLLAETVVVRSRYSSEDQADLDSLLVDFVGDYQPVGLTEQILVERLATAYWRLRRVQQFETGCICDRLELTDVVAARVKAVRAEFGEAMEAMLPGIHAMLDSDAAAKARQEPSREQREWSLCLPTNKQSRMIVRYETMLERRFNRALSDLYRYREYMAREAARQDACELEEHPLSRGERISLPPVQWSAPSAQSDPNTV